MVCCVSHGALVCGAWYPDMVCVLVFERSYRWIVAEIFLVTILVFSIKISLIVRTHHANAHSLENMIVVK